MLLATMATLAACSICKSFDRCNKSKQMENENPSCCCHGALRYILLYFFERVVCTMMLQEVKSSGSTQSGRGGVSDVAV